LNKKCALQNFELFREILRCDGSSAVRLRRVCCRDGFIITAKGFDFGFSFCWFTCSCPALARWSINHGNGCPSLVSLYGWYNGFMLLTISPGHRLMFWGRQRITITGSCR
jgi:hypothetical protein